MPTSSIVYIGELRTTAIHIKSGNQVITDAPTDNHGKGEAFSPTDLLATSLGSCMLTIIGISAEKNGFSVERAKVEITKVMTSSPRRVDEIIVEFYMPANHYSEVHKELIYNAAVNCPVAKSLHSDLKQRILFHYNE